MVCAIFQGHVTVCFQYIYHGNVLLLTNLMESDKQYKWYFVRFNFWIIWVKQNKSQFHVH